MSDNATIEQRLQALEAQMREVRRKLNGSGRSWFDVMAGAFENDPDFEEAARLGREFRDSENNSDDD